MRQSEQQTKQRARCSCYAGQHEPIKLDTLLNLKETVDAMKQSLQHLSAKYDAVLKPPDEHDGEIQKLTGKGDAFGKHGTNSGDRQFETKSSRP